MASTNRTKSEAVRVIARFRPSNKREKQEWQKYSDSKWQNETEIPVSASGPTIKIENPSTGRPYRFTYDEVLWDKTSQEDTFQTVAAPCCRNALNGFNGTIFAYGQTGSGKTHTIIGPEGKYSAKDSGIVPRAANFFFHAIENSVDIDTAELKVSFLEVYRGSLRDLNPAKKNYPDLKIRQKMNNETFVENLNETTVHSLGQILKLIQNANSHRTMAATSMNKTSSRSHLIITFLLKIRKTPEAGGHKLSSKVNFIDLAGSEKVKKTGASGTRLKEATSINSGLSTLSRVIEALAKKRQSIPFRDSVLTWILKDSLAGNTKSTLIVTGSPHQFNKEESISTCRFASRCKLIKTLVSSNKELTPQQMKSLIKRLQKENVELRDKVDLGTVNDDNEVINNYKSKVAKLERKISKLSNNDKKQDDDGDNDDPFASQREEYEENIKNLNAEIDNLKTTIEQSDTEKRSLAVMNGLLAERLDSTEKEMQNDQMIADMARSNLEYIKSDKDALLKDLEDLRFNSDEAQEIYDNVFNEIQTITEELDDKQKDLEELEDKLEATEAKLEKRNHEISKISQQLENMGDNGGKKNKNQKNKKNNKNNKNNDESKYNDDDDVVATSFTLKSNVDLDDQETYLQELADKEQELWEEREERAWKKYLNSRAKEEGFKKGKELLKSRRKAAEKDVKNGTIDEVPEDEALLEDIRDDFYRLYDPATGQIREDDDDDDDDENKDIEEELDENSIDDPYEWDEERVSEWLKEQNLKKYSKSFKKEGIDGRVLLVDLNKTNLKRDLGVKSVHVDKMMRGIQELRALSAGYDEWRRDQGIEDDDIIQGGGPLSKLNQNQSKIKSAINIDDELDMDEEIVVVEDEDFELTEEEKQFGEQFWGLDELFHILDIHSSGELDRSSFKHGLHALRVELTDDEMDDVFREIVNNNPKNIIEYKAFLHYLQFLDLLGPQSKKYAMDIMAALPRVAANRRQYVTRAAMVIKYAIRYNNTKTEINNYLQNKGLNRAECDAAWKQYRFNPKAIRDIDFKSLIGRKGKLIDMAIKDPDNVEAFNDYSLYKLLKRAGFKSFGCKEFNDLDYLRASGNKSRISRIKCWYDPQSQFFNGLQLYYECANGEELKGGRNMIRQGQYVEDDMKFKVQEIIISVTIYFAHFVCGLLIQTNERTRLFGSDLGRHQVVLAAPAGTCIMAFYGSIGRLVETLGCYVVVSNLNNGKNKQLSGKQSLKHKGNINAKIQKQSSKYNNIEGDGGDGNNTTIGAGSNTSKKSKKNKKKDKKNKKKKLQQNDDYDDDNYDDGDGGGDYYDDDQ